jgi:hypothetical protein
MDGFVTDYISTFTGETGRQPRYDEYTHIMTGCTPGQLPVLNGIATVGYPGARRNPKCCRRPGGVTFLQGLTGAISSSVYLHSLVN